MSYESSVIIIATALLGATGGYLLRILVSLSRQGSMEVEIKRRILDAQEQAKHIISDAETKAQNIRDKAQHNLNEREDELKKSEERLRERETFLDSRQTELDKKENALKQQSDDCNEREHYIANLEQQKQQELERISSLSQSEALNELYSRIEHQHAEDLLIRTQKLERFSLEKLEKKAQEILATSINRLANSVSSDLMTTTVSLPSDEIKGKIIGKDGRNIRTFERISGVELLIDDTPGTITLSSFDPIRRHIAHRALEELIHDGRIQPTRIEEVIQTTKAEINNEIKQKGEEAVYECGIYNLDPRIISILGRLHFHTSYGQNVLQHSIEMAHIAGMLAEELNADVATAKAGALLHDIGKALDHEVVGTHVEIGRRILMRFGADEAIIKAMQPHHEEYPFETIESLIVQSADAISGARPGARHDTVENFLKRLSDLEEIANSFEGVDHSYALQAGREVRVFVEPEAMNDYEAHQLARNIVTRIENEMKYPGEIKVNVIRESRSVEFAR